MVTLKLKHQGQPLNRKPKTCKVHTPHPLQSIISKRPPEKYENKKILPSIKNIERAKNHGKRAP